MATDSPNGPVSDRVTVPHPQGQYDVLLGRGLIDHIDLHTPLSSAGFRPASLHNGAATRALVVTDDVVAPLYAARLLDRLRTIGFAPRLFVFPAGERQKTLPTLSDIYAACVDAGARLGEYTVLGQGVRVRSGAELERTVVHENAYLGESVKLRGTVVGRAADLRRNARCEEGVVLGDEVFVGEDAVISTDVKVYPFKTVEGGAVVNTSSSANQ